jgi:hypothetical protein
MEGTPPVRKKWVEITDATPKGDLTRDQQGQITQRAQWGPCTPEALLEVTEVTEVTFPATWAWGQ